jgi:hypothetical protein
MINMDRCEANILQISQSQARQDSFSWLYPQQGRPHKCTVERSGQEKRETAHSNMGMAKK